MITLQYGPVYTSVTSPDEDELQAVCLLLSQAFTFTVPGYIFTPAYINGWWDGRESFFEMGKQRFMSGLLSKVLKVLKDAEVDLAVTGLPQPIKTPELGHKPIHLHPDIVLRDYQTHAIVQALKYRKGIWKLATNAGKTEVMAGLLKVLDCPPTICYVPRQEIFFQTVERLQQRLRVPIGALGAGKWDPHYNGINVGMYHTLFKHSKKKTVANWMRSVSVKFGDECHMMSDRGYAKAFQLCEAPTCIGMSGTPLKENVIEEYRVRGLCGPVIANVGNKELIEQGVSVRPKVVFLEPKVDNVERKMKWEHEHWETALHNVPQRNQLIGNLAYGFVKTGRQTIVMVAKTAHGLLLQKYIPDSVMVHSGSSDRRRVKDRLAAGEVFCCIATPIFDTGLSVDYLECLINAAGGNAMHTLLQRLGRLLRRARDKEKDVWFLDFWDTFNRITRSHSRDRWELLKAEGTFDMMESADCLPEDVYTEVWEGAGTATGTVRKSHKAKWRSI